ncbi:unnamed protein product [Miscanthus lutarioriparius]|uniref:Beta'-coat protein n=1 Tax=Miscanthus lutarioriparius TaxID=422564 RepID=A0A811QDU1_9POAL|nr:unnamed protein product [Miscanthus lutarioriparius]
MVAKLIARKEWFVAGDEDGYIHVYRYRAMQQLTYFQAHICSLRWSRSSKFILSEYEDPDICHFGYFANGDQQYLMTGDLYGTVKIWSMHAHNLVETVKDAHFRLVEAICSDPEHAVLVTGSADGTVCLWNPNTLRPERTFNFGLGYVKDVKVCTDSSRRVVIAHQKGLAMIEIDGNDPVVANTGSSSEVENDLVGSRKRKRPEHDRAEIKNEENDFVVSVMDTGNGAKQTQGIGPRDEEIHSVTDTGNVAEQMQGNGQTDEEMNSVSSKLLGVYPGKLQLPFKANQLTSCSLKLTNTTDDHVAVRLLTKCPKRYIAKMPLCCIVPPKCIYTLIVTVSDQKKRSQLSSDEFLTLESTICLEQDIVVLQNANLNSEAIEFSNFFKQAKDMAADKVYELKLSVVSNPLKETTSVKVVSNRKFSHVLSLDAHPTEPWILTTNQAGEVAIWDYQVQAIAKSFDFTQRPVYSAKFIAREEWIVAGDGYGMIYVYNYNTEEEVTSIEAHDSDITSLDVHPTDPLVLSSSEDHLIKLWNWRKKNWKCIRTFEGHSDRVKHVNFNPMDTNSFATASLDHTIKIWNISSPESKITMSDHPDGLLCVHSYTIDMRQYLIAGSWDGTAQIWDMETGRLVQTLKGHVRHISCVYHHPELPVVITGSHDGTVRLWNSTTYRLESIVGINLGVVHALGYIKDLRR